MTSWLDDLCHEMTLVFCTLMFLCQAVYMGQLGALAFTSILGES